MNFLIRLVAVGVHMHSSRINMCMVRFLCKHSCLLSMLLHYSNIIWSRISKNSLVTRMYNESPFKGHSGMLVHSIKSLLYVYFFPPKWGQLANQDTFCGFRGARIRGVLLWIYLQPSSLILDHSTPCTSTVYIDIHIQFSLLHHFLVILTTSYVSKKRTS